MKRSMKLLIATMVCVAMSITSFAFAVSSIVKDTASSIDGQILVLKAIDDRIVANKVDVLYLRVGSDDDYVVKYTDAIAKTGNRVVQADGVKYTINDGNIIMEFDASSDISRLFGRQTQNIRIRVTLTNGEFFIVHADLIGDFKGATEVPEYIRNGDYLFTDYKFNSNGFWDDTEGADPNYNAVKYLKDRGIVKGTTEGYLFPDSNITLKEFIAMMSRAMNYMGRARNNDLTRVYGANMVDNEYDSWVKDDYARLMNLWGTQSGETTDRGKAILTKVLNVEASENLNSSVTREEAAIMIGSTLGELFMTNEQTQNFDFYTDWNTVKEKALIRVLMIRGVNINHYNLELPASLYEVPIKNIIEPNKELTRIQAIKLIYEMMHIQNYMELKKDPFVQVTGNAAQTVITLPNDGVQGQKLTIRASNPVDNIVAVRYYVGHGLMQEITGISTQEFSQQIAPPNGHGLYRVGVCVITADGSMSDWAEKDIYLSPADMEQYMSYYNNVILKQGK